MRRVCLASCIVLMCASFAFSTTKIGEPGFKYRILVDKVYMQGNDRGMLTDADMKKIADIGFNVISPRLNGDCPDLIRQQAGLAKKHGLYYMGWLRGSLPANRLKWRELYGGLAKFDQKALQAKYGDPLVYTPDNGCCYDFLSPNSDELWDKITTDVMAHVELSKEFPIIGTFLDFEIYQHSHNPWNGHLYTLSYDKKIWDGFFVSRNEKSPEGLDEERAGIGKERAEYLVKCSLDNDFEAYQIKQWQGRMRKLRQAVDKINPKFQFVSYPSNYTLFSKKAIFEELGTKDAPLLTGEHYTYWKGCPIKDNNPDHRFVSVKEGLALNRNFVRNCIAKYKNYKSPTLVIGGMDPLLPVASDAFFQSMSAVVMSQAGAGYWVFFEGPSKHSSWMDDFENWFKQANTAIENGSFVLPKHGNIVLSK